ncbi:fatty acid oxidation complex subunit alpha FadJ [Sphingobacteriales bacterium UPWRP_1]|nr:hypothetical protein BVG80_10515 [Sphingobacteriales bacterium TSM_CSM]PSJ78850.1 fatty acid oxidation complex subunit alpha FadJ [Sphingobacteriales bacterium UPWRP_1]
MERTNYLSIEKENGIATLWLDKKDDKQNIISPDLIGLFDEVFAELEADASVKAVVIISRKKDFIAGADIKAFKAEKPGDFQPISRKGHEIMNRLEHATKPVVAAISGTCYGLGVEMALACHARIVTDDRSTKLALPEVKLGLLPGGGGTQRLPRLIGIQKALDMMLTGKNIYPYQALKMGLADAVVNKNKLHQAACKLALQLTQAPLHRKDKRTFTEKLLEKNILGQRLIFSQARKTVQRLTQGNYPAPFEIINCVETGISKGLQAGYATEVERFEKLILSPESKQLINIFFIMSDKKKNPMAELVKPVNTIAMLGAGFMGAGITEVSITNNINVILKDIKNETISSAQKTIWDAFYRKVKRKAMQKVEAMQLMNRIHPQLDYHNFTHADIIIEAVFEDLGIKQKVLAECEANARPDTIFASNTSALPISAIAQHAKRPELVIGMHYFSPVPKMPLLEIVKTPQTADWVVATCLQTGIEQGKTCIVVKDGPGFYTTRILAPYLNEALLLLEEGAEIDLLDREMKQFGYPVGPVALMDEVGIDVGAHIMSGDLMKSFISLRPDLKVSEALLHMHKAGYSGRKNKKGFYLYDPKTGKKIRGKVNTAVYDYFGGVQSRHPFKSADVQQRMAMSMVNEAALCLQEGIIENPTDGDVGAVFGLGFPPFRGGPFRFIDSFGADNVVKVLQQLQNQHGNRFAPASILVQYAQQGKKFYP